jgi:serine/threonine-protein kinase PpkA
MDLLIPGFEIEGEIGEGAMATVYLATQRSLERKVALKIMSAALAADPAFCERFLREGKTLARLSHPQTVTIHDIGNVGDMYYMAMEYLPNGTLKQRIAAGMSAEQSLTYLRQIALALGYAHAQDLVHRDVKPANILFRTDGAAVLSDFGIAKSLDDRTQFTQAGFALGTPNYMSPEQARGLEIDGRADLYALGVVFYEMLAGKLPYSGTDALSTALAHLTEPLPELPAHHGRYQHILAKLLAKNRDDRFADATELISALDSLPLEDVAATIICSPAIQPERVPSAPDAQPQSPRCVLETPRTFRERRGRDFLLLVGAMATALGVGIGGYRWSSTDKSAATATSPDSASTTPSRSPTADANRMVSPLPVNPSHNEALPNLIQSSALLAQTIGNYNLRLTNLRHTHKQAVEAEDEAAARLFASAIEKGTRALEGTLAIYIDNLAMGARYTDSVIQTQLQRVEEELGHNPTLVSRAAVFVRHVETYRQQKRVDPQTILKELLASVTQP